MTEGRNERRPCASIPLFASSFAWQAQRQENIGRENIRRARSRGKQVSKYARPASLIRPWTTPPVGVPGGCVCSIAAALPRCKYATKIHFRCALCEHRPGRPPAHLPPVEPRLREQRIMHAGRSIGHRRVEREGGEEGSARLACPGGRLMRPLQQEQRVHQQRAQTACEWDEGFHVDRAQWV